MSDTMIQPQQFDSIFTLFFCFLMSHATHQQGHDNILHDIIGRDQLIVLENEPDLLVAYHGQIVLLGLVDCHAIQIIFPTVHHIHTADHIH